MYLIYLPNISLIHCNDTYLWLSPNLCLNSDGDTETFFTLNPMGLNVEVSSFRVTFLKGLHM